MLQKIGVRDMAGPKMRQQEVYELRHSEDPPLSFAEIGRRLGMTKGNAWKAYHRYAARLEGQTRQPVVRSDATEVKDPEKAAAYAHQMDPGSGGMVEREASPRHIWPLSAP